MSPTGAIILAVFGAIWCGAALAAMTGGVHWLTFAPALVAIAIIAVAIRVGRTAPKRSDADGKRIGRIIGLASAFEGVAIPIAATALGSTGHYDLVMPAIAAIVALHFVPIAWATPYPPFFAVAALMLALAAGSLLLPPTAARMMAVGFGSAILLWAACGLALARTARLSASAATLSG